MGNDAKGCVTVGSAEPSSRQAVSKTVAYEIKDVGA